MNFGTEAEKIRDLCQRARNDRVTRTPVSEQPARRSFAKLKPAQSAEILRRYQAGDRPIAIAKAFGVTEWTVQNIRKRAGVSTRPHGMSPESIERAISLKEAGMSVRKIATAIGHHPATISKELKARGVKI